MVKKKILCLFATLMAVYQSFGYKVGLCMVATGRYDIYAQQLIESARKYFLKNHQVTYFVFTDGKIEEAPDVVSVYQKRLGWPYDTLMRFSIYAKHKDAFKDMDYIFATDADMLFVAPVEDKILGKLVATRHPGFMYQRGTYEANPKSTAYVAPHEGKFYFAGGFYGAQKKDFFKMIEILTQKIEIDHRKDYIAIWHDESHLNRYFIDNKPTTVLSPTYCCPETWQMPGRKLLALDKDHAKMRK